MLITKTCNQCSITKPLDQFFKDKSTKDGFYTVCKPCKTHATIAWRAMNREKYNETMRAYSKKHRRRTHLQTAYGMTIDRYNEMLKTQDMKCWICEKQNMSNKRPLVVDHCHATGRVRGLLCYGCNRALATLEAPGLLARAELYLETFA